MSGNPSETRGEDDTPGAGFGTGSLGYARLVRDLPRLLAAPLPGFPAQSVMAPRPAVRRDPAAAPDDVVHAAGLFLVAGPEPARLVLTLRAEHLPTHRGQVSLPGGVREPDETLEAAALREAHEEAGLESHHVRVLGQLSPLFIPVSRFLLHPVVALCDRLPPLRPSPDEVSRILTPDLEQLADPSRLRVAAWKLAGRERDVPLIEVEGELLWGATAMIVAEFLALAGRPLRVPGA